MPGKPALPERLRYLQAFRKKFASRPESLNEEEAEGPLFDLMNRRIKGLPESEAQDLLQGDLDCLESWLSLPEHENDCLQFVRGFLMLSPSGMVQAIREQATNPPPPLVELDFPDSFKPKRIANRTEAALLLRHKGILASLQAMPEELAVKMAGLVRPEHTHISVTSSPVQFGSVHGSKSVFMRSDLVMLLGTRQKSVDYLLIAPGGHVCVWIVPIGKKVNHEKWDESIFENLFHTLRVV